MCLAEYLWSSTRFLPDQTSVIPSSQYDNTIQLNGSKEVFLS